MHRVEAQEMRVGLDRAEIVDGDHLDVLAARFGYGAHDVAADAAEAIDGDAYRHVSHSRTVPCVMADMGHGTY